MEVAVVAEAMGDLVEAMVVAAVVKEVMVVDQAVVMEVEAVVKAADMGED